FFQNEWFSTIFHAIFQELIALFQRGFALAFVDSICLVHLLPFQNRKLQRYLGCMRKLYFLSRDLIHLKSLASLFFPTICALDRSMHRYLLKSKFVQTNKLCALKVLRFVQKIPNRLF